MITALGLVFRPTITNTHLQYGRERLRRRGDGTAEVWTLGGLVTYDVLFFIHLGSRRVQVARTVTMEAWGCLSPGQYLIHDRDGKYCPAF